VESGSPLKVGGTLRVVASSTIGAEEMVFHSLFIGATGAGKTEVLLSAENVDGMRQYSALFGLVCGGMKFEDFRPSPAFLSECLP
jgi:hypothetical protein